MLPAKVSLDSSAPELRLSRIMPVLIDEELVLELGSEPRFRVGLLSRTAGQPVHIFPCQASAGPVPWTSASLVLKGA